MYRIKENNDEPHPMQVDSGKDAAADVVQVGKIKINVKDAQKGPMTFGGSILLPRGLQCLMIMRPVAVAPRISTLNLGGAHRG